MPSFLIIIIATILYAGVHSFLATLGVKARARNWFGGAVDRWYRLAYNLFAGVSFLPILWLMAVLPDQSLYTIPFPLVVVSTLGQFAGVLIILLGIWQADAWSFLGLRQFQEKQVQPQTTELSINGLYRWVRHPLYTGALLLLWLTPIMTVNILSLIIVLSIYLVVGAILEERRLTHEFGGAYAEYQKRVPMLLPRIKKNI